LADLNGLDAPASLSPYLPVDFLNGLSLLESDDDRLPEFTLLSPPDLFSGFPNGLLPDLPFPAEKDFPVGLDPPLRPVPDFRPPVELVLGIWFG
jgi:hypothetical protein